MRSKEELGEVVEEDEGVGEEVKGELEESKEDDYNGGDKGEGGWMVEEKEEEDGGLWDGGEELWWPRLPREREDDREEGRKGEEVRN